MSQLGDENDRLEKESQSYKCHGGYKHKFAVVVNQMASIVMVSELRLVHVITLAFSFLPAMPFEVINKYDGTTKDEDYTINFILHVLAPPRKDQKNGRTSSIEIINKFVFFHPRIFLN